MQNSGTELPISIPGSPLATCPSYEHKLDVTRKYMTEDSTVVEIGCGTGSTALLHAPYVKNILATDLSPKMIEIAQSKLTKDQVENVTFKVSSVEELVLEEPVDMVMAMSLLHLVEDKRAVIKHIYDWLKPGGTFVSSTVCMGEKYWIFKYLGPIGNFLGLLPHLDVFTPDDLKSCLIRMWI